MQETWQECGFNSWIRKLSWRRKWQPIPVFFPGEIHGQRSLVDYAHGVTKSLIQLSNFTHSLIIKQVNQGHTWSKLSSHLMGVNLIGPQFLMILKKNLKQMIYVCMNLYGKHTCGWQRNSKFI